MAVSNGAFGSANNVTTTTAATFIPSKYPRGYNRSS